MRLSMLIVPFVMLAGCAHKPDVKTEPPPAVAKAEPQPQKAEVTDASALKSCTQDSDCKESEVCGAQRQCVAISASMLNDCSLMRVHLGVNSIDIQQADRSR